MHASRRLTATALLLGGLAATGTASAQDQPHRGFGPGMGFDFTEIDADGDGRVTVTELQTRATARLGSADTNGDGSLDRAEIVAVMPEHGGGFFRPFAASRGEAFADRMLAMMGATESGRIVITELAERRSNDAMAMLDTDRDGAISAEEAERPHGRMAGRRGEHGEHGHRPRF